MRASERLKVLECRWNTSEFMDARQDLVDALPELIAVVEAAEIFWSDDVVDGMKATENLDKALAALDAKLTTKGER